MIRLQQPQAVSNFQETRLKALLKKAFDNDQIPSGILSGLVTLRHTPTMTLKEAEKVNGLTYLPRPGGGNGVVTR